jgi:rhodanese-related sulfurtransferase
LLIVHHGNKSKSPHLSGKKEAVMFARVTKAGGATVIAVLFIVISFISAADATEFPLRAKYPKVKPIETAELKSIYNNAIIVDARAKAEYEVIRMVGSTNILVGVMTEADLLKLRAKDGKAPLVFYCNGITCSKSYKASKKAIGWGFKNVRCFDLGIFNWAKASADKTELFGKVLSTKELEAALISKDDFKSKQLAPADFLSRSKGGNFAIIDIRSPSERNEVRVSLPRTKAISFDNLLKMIESKSKAVPTSNILVIDNVGKQVRWLQYYFERAGITNYFFMQGGAKKWVKDGYGPNGEK